MITVSHSQLVPASPLIRSLYAARAIPCVARHGIRQCSHGVNAIQMPFPCRVRAGRSQGERSLLIAPILEHERTEMEKSCTRVRSPRVSSRGFLAASGFGLRGRFTFLRVRDTSTIEYQPTIWRIAVVRSPLFPRFLRHGKANKSGRTDPMEFKCERICRHSVTRDRAPAVNGLTTSRQVAAGN